MPCPFPTIIPVFLEGGWRGGAHCKYLPPKRVACVSDAHSDLEPVQLKHRHNSGYIGCFARPQESLRCGSLQKVPRNTKAPP